MTYVDVTHEEHQLNSSLAQFDQFAAREVPDAADEFAPREAPYEFRPTLIDQMDRMSQIDHFQGLLVSTVDQRGVSNFFKSGAGADDARKALQASIIHPEVLKSEDFTDSFVFKQRSVQGTQVEPVKKSQPSTALFDNTLSTSMVSIMKDAPTKSQVLNLMESAREPGQKAMIASFAEHDFKQVTQSQVSMKPQKGVF